MVMRQLGNRSVGQRGADQREGQEQGKRLAGCGHAGSPEVRSALEETKAPLLYISNLVTQPGETDIQTVSRHVEILNEYLGSRKIDLVVANNGTVDENVRERYLSAENKRIVQVDHITLEKMGVQIIEDDIFCIEDEKIRHNALKTAFLIFSYLMEA